MPITILPTFASSPKTSSSSTINLPENCFAFANDESSPSRGPLTSLCRLIMGQAASAHADRRHQQQQDKRNRLSKPKLGGSGRRREPPPPLDLRPSRPRSGQGFVVQKPVQKPVKRASKTFSFRNRFSHRISVIEPIPELEDSYYEERMDTPSPVRAYTLHNPESPRIARRISLPVPPRQSVVLEPVPPLPQPPTLSIPRRRSLLFASMPAVATRRSFTMPIFEAPMDSPLSALDLATERVQTPSAYSVIGAFKRGSLRIMNGAASPTPSTTTVAPSLRPSLRDRDLSPSVASFHTLRGARQSPYANTPSRTPIPRLPNEGDEPSYFSEMRKQPPPSSLRRARSLDSVRTERENAGSPFSFVASPRVLQEEEPVFSKVSAVDDALFEDPVTPSVEGEGDEHGEDEWEEEEGEVQYGIAFSDVAEDGSTFGQERSPSLHLPAMVYRMPSSSTFNQKSTQNQQNLTPAPMLSPALSDISSAASIAYHEAVAAEVREKVIRLTMRTPTSPTPPTPPPKPRHMNSQHKSTTTLSSTKSAALLRSKKGSDSGYSTASSNNSVRARRRSKNMTRQASGASEAFYTPPAQPERKISFSRDGMEKIPKPPRISIQTAPKETTPHLLPSPLPDSGISPSSPLFTTSEPLTLSPLRPLSPFRLPSFESGIEELSLSENRPSPIAERAQHSPPPQTLRIEPSAKERRVLGRVNSNHLRVNPHLANSKYHRKSPISPRLPTTVASAPGSGKREKLVKSPKERRVLGHQKSLPAIPVEKARTRVVERVATPERRRNVTGSGFYMRFARLKTEQARVVVS